MSETLSPTNVLMPSIADKRSLKEVQLELAKEEMEALARGGAVQESSVCVFIMTALEIEESQCVPFNIAFFIFTDSFHIRRGLEIEIKSIRRGTTTQELNIQKLRTSLFRRIQKFLTLQQAFMPRLREHISPSQTHHLDNPSTTEPEKIKLLLPSDLRDRATRLLVCVADTMETETRLRQAETHDALEELRQGLRARTATNRFKTRNTTGQVANTRAQGIQRQIDLRIHSSKLRYRYSRTALFKLKGHGDWERDLQILQDEDVRGLNERAMTREELASQEALREMGRLNLNEPGGVTHPGVVVLGESSRTLSWIWYRTGRAESEDGVINEGRPVTSF